MFVMFTTIKNSELEIGTSFLITYENGRIVPVKFACDKRDVGINDSDHQHFLFLTSNGSSLHCTEDALIAKLYEEDFNLLTNPQ
jgi:hypothetical protein